MPTIADLSPALQQRIKQTLTMLPDASPPDRKLLIELLVMLAWVSGAEDALKRARSRW